jgi:PAS domain S-box-containing protein
LVKLHNPITKTVIYLIIFVSAFIHLSALYLGKHHYANFRWENIPVHTAIEVAGSFIAFYVAYLLIALDKKRQGTSYNISIAAAMVGMGVIDGVHALVQPGQLFVWLHSSATFWGGCLFVLVLLPCSIQKTFSNKLPLVIFFVTLGFSVFSIIFSDSLPQMATPQGFTSIAIFLNVFGGTLLLIVSVRLYFTFRRYQKTDDLLFVLLSSMFGLAAIMFEQSTLWDLPWWGWHILRFSAYGVALWFALSSDLLAQLATEEKNATLDSQLHSTNLSLQISEVQQKAILNSLSDAVIITDNAGKISLFTPAAERMFGYNQEDITGNSVKVLMPEEVAINHDGYMAEYKKEKTSLLVGQNRELIAKRKDNSTFPVEITITPVILNDQKHVVGLIRDITSRKQNEKALQQATLEAKQANQAKSAFLANMSHEIRTPMNGVYGTLQLLKGEQLSEKGRGFINNAEYSCKNLLTIINDILDFSKIEAGQLNVENLPFSLKSVVEKISSDMLPLAINKNITFEVNSQLTHDMWIGDPVRVGQVMLNLTSNAVKFTEQGKVTLSLSLQQSSTDTLVIEVLDTGIGMDKKAMDNLFSRFSQADDSTTRKYGGTGLGLSITQSLVHLMGGQISVDSKINQGTTIRVMLPLKKAQATTEGLGLTSTPESKLNLKGKHILIAEDNTINQAIIEAMLEPYNPTLTMVANGEEAVQSALANRPDLILMDIQMPVKDGVTACQEILVFMPDIPIVALTANVMTQDIETYLQAGFVAHLGKPYEISVLEEKLKQLLLDS